MELQPVITILRLEESRQYGTFGCLLLQGKAFCATLEPPYMMNSHYVSCIPVGQYEALRVPSRKFDEVYLLPHVPGRSGIELHPGNTLHDTQGCIILGETWGKFRTGERVVLNSGNTFKRFMRALESYPAIIVSIRNAW